MPGPSKLSKLRIPFSFRRMPLIGKVLRMKTPLKKGIRIRLANSSNCKLVVAPVGIFSVFLKFFFLSRHLVRVCTERHKFRDLPWRDYDVAFLRADVAPLCYRLWLSRLPPLRQPMNRALPTMVKSVRYHHASLLEVFVSLFSSLLIFAFSNPCQISSLLSWLPKQL